MKRFAWRSIVPLAVMGAAAVLLVVDGYTLWRDGAEDARIRDFAAGHDSPLDRRADARLFAARGIFLLTQGRVDDAQAALDMIGPQDDGPRNILLYALANAHLRRALDVFDSAPMRRVAPLIGLAKSEYRLVLAIDPDNWDARYNFDIASALSHDPEAASFLKGDDMARERALVPDAPGAPNGLP